MDIQAAQYQNRQSFGALRILQSYERTAQIHKAKVHNISHKRDSVSISAKGIFASVTLYEEDVEAYYGTKIITGSHTGKATRGCSKEKFAELDFEKIHQVELPKELQNIDSGGFFYHGQSVSGNELIQLAVSEGKMTMEEVEENPFRAQFKAFDVMIAQQAETKYGWSSTKYSEDGKYTFTKKEDGSYEWHLVQDKEMGASLEEIAGWICSGTPNRNIENRYLDYLRRMDPDLYRAAQQIGKEVRNYALLTVAYDAGMIGEAQHDYDLSLLAMLFHRTGDEGFYAEFMKARKTGDFECLLQNYDPACADALNEIRWSQMEKSGGGIM